MGKTIPSHVVIVNDFAHISGGTAQVALSSAKGLADRGIRVTVFAAIPPVTEALASDNLTVVCTGQHEILRDPDRMRAAVQGIWNFKAARVMKKTLASLDPARTVIHVHGWTKALSSSVVRAALKAGFRVVCTMHDYFLACPNGGFFNYPNSRICALSPLSRECIRDNCDMRNYAQKLWRICRQVVQKNIGNMPGGIRHFIAISDFSQNILMQYLPKNVRVHAVDNPIEIAKQEPVDVASNTAFVSVGRFSREKGLNLFAAAASRIPVKAVFVGDGPCRDEIAALHPSAVLTGWLARPHVIERMRSARALVFPSFWYEGRPLVILEASAMGIPAIVPDTSAARDMVADGFTGLWFRGGDVKDLQEKIKVLMNAGKAAAMGKSAYERYWMHPNTMDRHIDELLAVYNDVLA